MPTTTVLLLALSSITSLCPLGFLVWAIAKRKFILTRKEASAIFEAGETGVPDDPTVFRHRMADSDAHRFDVWREKIDAAGRAPVLLMISAATLWLVVGSIHSVTSSLKLHVPAWLPTGAPLTFGSGTGMHLNLVAYGWLSLAGIAVALWLLPRIFHAPMRHPRVATFGALSSMLGVGLGVTSMATGWTQGVGWLEFSWQISLLIALGGACLALPILITAKHRKSHHIDVSGWYLLGALLWFPILSVIANLAGWHAGVQQATANWWFAPGVPGIWLTPLSVGTAYYLIPKIIGKPVYSYSLSLLGFCGISFFYSEIAIYPTIGGLVPTWMVTLSIVHSLMMFVPVVAIGVNQHVTVARNFWAFRQSIALRFVSTGATMYTLTSFQGLIEALRSADSAGLFTHNPVGHAHLGAYGFVSLVMSGAFYYMLPYLTGRNWPWRHLLSLHYWLAVGGVVMYSYSLFSGDALQGFDQLEAGGWFADVIRGTGPYLQARSIGATLMTLGHFVFAFHIAALLLGRGAPRPGASPPMASLATGV